MPSEVIQLCRDLVAMPSVNPQDRTSFDQPFGEARLAAFVADQFRSWGLDAQLCDVSPGRANVVAIAPGMRRDAALVLCAHLDTVDVNDMTIDPFDPELRDGRLFGRGSCDTKASLAAMMLAFRTRAQQGSLPADLVFLATCGEEYDMRGAHHFVQQSGITPAAAIFGEPTGLSVVSAHKGTARFRLRAKGRSAHSSNTKLGCNAIYPIAHAIVALENHAEQLSHACPHEQLGTETLAVTIVNGGQQVNVIPDTCSAQIDWRLLPSRNTADCLVDLDRLIGHLPISVESFSEYAPMATDPAHPLVGRLLQTSLPYTNRNETVGVSYATDASAFAHLNIPTPILGPGHIAQAHSPDEYIETEQLDNALAIYSGYLSGDWGV